MHTRSWLGAACAVPLYATHSALAFSLSLSLGGTRRALAAPYAAVIRKQYIRNRRVCCRRSWAGAWRVVSLPGVPHFLTCPTWRGQLAWLQAAPPILEALP